MFLKELEAAIQAGLLAKDKIMEIYNQEFDVEIKDDDSPVTIADKTADKMIRDYLSNLFPTHAFLTEESEDSLERLNNDYVWIVDPVDGTKDFVAKDGQFTTNIALAYKHEVVVGVVIAPALNQYYYAMKGHGAYFVDENGNKTQIHVNDKTEGLIVLTSVFHLQKSEVELIERYKDKISHYEKVGSSLKACTIAKGQAELSYRLSAGTKEWDIAACDIIIQEAGGLFVKPNGETYKYNREDVYNREGYVIVNRKENILL